MNRPSILLTLLAALVAPAALSAQEAAKATFERNTDESLRAFVERTAGRFVYEIHLGGKKVGWAADEIGFEKVQGEEVARFSSRSQLTMSLFGETVKHEQVIVSRYRLTGDGALVDVLKQDIDDDRKVEFRVEPVGKGLRIITLADGEKSTREVSASKDTLKQMQRLDHWIASHPKAGATFLNYGLDLREEPKPRTDESQTHIYKGRAKRTHFGQSVEVALVRMQSEEELLDFELLPAGQLRFGKVGPCELRLVQDEAAARQVQVEVLDRLFEIPVEAELGHPRKLDFLVLELTGVPEDFKIPTNRRQRIRERDGQRVVLELHRGELTGEPETLSAEDQREYTRATKTIQSDHARVQKIAKRVAGDEANRLDQCNLLKSWVYGYVRASYTDNARTAVEILNNASGDCTECSLLFVSLARSLGIPAREVGGLLYVKENGRNIFTWHAWCEVHDGKRWVGVDPAWNEVGVDAAHILLSTGPDDNHWVQLVSAMKIKVLEHKKQE